MSDEMKRALEAAKIYGDWFGISHHPHAPVPARHQTVKALYRRGLLERLERTVYNSMGWPSGARVQYRFKQPEGES